MAYGSSHERSIDQQIGENIRLRRIMMGLTQDQLAESLKLSYQQIQKYETGANRVSAGRLYQISLLLDADIVTFFPSEHGAQYTEKQEENASARHIIELVRRFSSIESQRVRAGIMSMIRSVTSPDDEVYD